MFQGSFKAFENIDNEINYALSTNAELLKKAALLTEATIKALDITVQKAAKEFVDILLLT